MIEPVDRFCDMLREFDQDDALELISFCCITLGREAKRTSRAYSEDVPLGQLFQDYTIDDLREHITMLVEQVGVRPEFLIPGLFHFLTEHYSKVSDSGATADSIDFHLERLAELEEDLERPPDRRRNQLSDEQLRSLIGRVKDIMSGKPGQRKNAEQLTDRLGAEWAERFSDDYWRDFAMRSIRRR
jgi:hypothetical protein